MSSNEENVSNAEQSEMRAAAPPTAAEQEIDFETKPNPLSEFSPSPRNLKIPDPMPKSLEDPENEVQSGSLFDPVKDQPRRDLYGGDIKQGIPTGFSNILHDISLAVLRTFNYNEPDKNTGKVFHGNHHLYEFLAAHFEARLKEREALTGKSSGMSEFISIYLFVIMSVETLYIPFLLHSVHS